MFSIASLDPLDLGLTLSHEHLSSYLLVASVVSLSPDFSLFPCRLAEPSLPHLSFLNRALDSSRGDGGREDTLRQEDQIPMSSLSSEERGASPQHCLPQGRSTKRRLISRQLSEDATSPSSLQNVIWRRHHCNITVTYIGGKLSHPPRRGLVSYGTHPYRWLFRTPSPSKKKKRQRLVWYHSDSKVIFSLQSSPLLQKRVICQIPNGPRLMDGG